MRKLFLLLVLLAAPALAEPREIITWETVDGTVGFTDELKKVPAKYRDAAEIITVDGLNDFERGTIRSDDGSYARGLVERLSYLRRANER